MTYHKALALTSALAIVAVGGAFWLLWYLLPLLLQTPFFSTSVLLLVASVGLALLIRVGRQHKQREEQEFQENANHKREREAQESAAREQEAAQQLETLKAARREAEESREREAAYAAEAERRVEEERDLRLKAESARSFFEGENADLREELRKLRVSRTEGSRAHGSSSASRSRRRRRENEVGGGWDRGEEATSIATRWQQELSEVVSELGLDKQNAASIGRLLNHGGLGHAEEGADGRMSAMIRIPEDEMTFCPSILVMPHGGELEIEFLNDDKNTHCAIVPSNGDYQWIWLPNHSRGKVNVTLDGPGYYWYSSNVGNDEGRGLMGAIVVMGDVPDEAKLDRPPQPRP